MYVRPPAVCSSLDIRAAAATVPIEDYRHPQQACVPARTVHKTIKPLAKTKCRHMKTLIHASVVPTQITKDVMKNRDARLHNAPSLPPGLHDYKTPHGMHPDIIFVKYSASAGHLHNAPQRAVISAPASAHAHPNYGSRVVFLPIKSIVETQANPEPRGQPSDPVASHAVACPAAASFASVAAVRCAALRCAALHRAALHCIAPHCTAAVALPQCAAAQTAPRLPAIVSNRNPTAGVRRALPAIHRPVTGCRRSR